MAHAGTRVLLVDHDVRELLALRAWLSAAGYAVSSASSSMEAFLRLEECTPELVVLSASVPELDLCALQEQLDARAQPAWVPIVALAEPAEVERLLAAGCDDVVTRPVQQAELLARLAARARARNRFEGLVAERRVLEQLAITDGLTALYNHRHFQQRLDEEFRRAARHRQPFSLLLIDLDRFKLINDTYGHPAGDAVLRQTSSILREQVRETDLVARYGGEEFAVLLPQTPRAGADEVAHRIGRVLGEAPFSAPTSVAPLRLTASIGVGHWPAPGITAPAALIAAADDALYRAKRAGRNQVVFAPARPALVSARSGTH